MPSNEPRDQLARLIFDLAVPQPPCPDCVGKPPNGTGGARAAADAAIQRGWRPPARVIKSMDEMEALPIGAIIRWGHHVEQSIGGGWLMTPSDPVICEAVFEAAQGVDDITVVWEPEEANGE